MREQPIQTKLSELEKEKRKAWVSIAMTVLALAAVSAISWFSMPAFSADIPDKAALSKLPWNSNVQRELGVNDQHLNTCRAMLKDLQIFASATCATTDSVRLDKQVFEEYKLVESKKIAAQYEKLGEYQQLQIVRDVRLMSLEDCYRKYGTSSSDLLFCIEAVKK